MRASQRHYPHRGCKGRAASPSVGAPSIGAHTQRHLRCARHLLEMSESLISRLLVFVFPAICRISLTYHKCRMCVDCVFCPRARREARSLD